MKLSPKLKISIIILFLVVFFLVLNLTNSSKTIKNFFYSISSPIQKTFWKAGDNISGFLKAISINRDSKNEIDNLKLTIEELRAENNKLRELKQENEFLRESLEIGLEKEFQLSLAEVIGKDISEDTLLINKGSNDGISENFPVINQRKALIGRIGTVYKDFSKVVLISNKESFFDAEISEKEVQGIIKGKGGNKLLLDLIPLAAEINKGELVTTASLGGIFPKGLLVGEIKEIMKNDIQPFQQAEIEPSFNLGDIKILFIITNF